MSASKSTGPDHDDGLFPADILAHTPAEDVRSAPVDKRFAPFDPHQVTLMPEALDDWLPAEHPARMIAEVVDNELDLTEFYAAYTATKGRPPYDSRMMVRILIYGYTTAVRSSRKLETACTDMVTFRWLAAGNHPDFRAFSRFRRRHLHALAGVFTQVLQLCRAAGMVSLGTIALDGTKVTADASRRKAMSYDRLVTTEQSLSGDVDELQGLVNGMLVDAEDTDTIEDKALGDAHGDKLPDELATKKGRLAKIRAAKAQIERETADAARDKAEARARDRGDDEATVADTGQDAAEKATPKGRAQRNFTDPESRIMKQAHGGFDYSFNAATVVDGDHQVIVATELDNNAADSRTFVPVLSQVFADAAAGNGAGGDSRLVPGEVLADAGYCSAENLRWAAQVERVYGELGTEFFVATGRVKHGETLPDTPCGPVPAGATGRELMGRRLRTKKGQAVYRKRKSVVEPVFGQIATRQGKHVLLRGLAAAAAEWKLICGVHNLLKLLSFRSSGSAVAGATG